MTRKPRRCFGVPFFIALRAGAAVLAAVLFSSQSSYAGELDSERDEDAGLAFVGSAREVGTLKPIPGVQIKAEIGSPTVEIVPADPDSGPEIAELLSRFGEPARNGRDGVSVQLPRGRCSQTR